MKTRFLLVRIYDVYSVLGFHPIKQIISHFGKAMTTSLRNITAGKDESDLTKPESTEKHS